MTVYAAASFTTDAGTSVRAIVTNHLISHGYTRIGGIFGMGSTTGHDRREGFLRALKEHNHNRLTELIKYANPREEDGFATTMKLLQLPEPPGGSLYQ